VGHGRERIEVVVLPRCPRLVVGLLGPLAAHPEALDVHPLLDRIDDEATEVVRERLEQRPERLSGLARLERQPVAALVVVLVHRDPVRAGVQRPTETIQPPPGRADGAPQLLGGRIAGRQSDQLAHSTENHAYIPRMIGRGRTLGGSCIAIATARTSATAATFGLAARGPTVTPVGQRGRGFLAKLGRVHTFGRRGLPRVRLRAGVPHRGVLGPHPWWSCTIDRAPRSCRCRAVRPRLRAARCDRRSGRWPGGRRAGSPGTSPRADHARHGALGRSGAARRACCTGRCGGCGSTGGRARCSDCHAGWCPRRRPCRASSVASATCIEEYERRGGAAPDAGDARLQGLGHPEERGRGRLGGLSVPGATPREPDHAEGPLTTSLAKGRQ